MTQIRRPHYFKGQFLKADDFIAEQQYHVQMRRLHNSSLHTWGVVDGLNVTANEARIKLSAGSAIDINGKEIWLPEGKNQLREGNTQIQEDTDFPIPPSTPDGSYFVVLSYKEGYDPESPYPPAAASELEDYKYIRKVETGEPGLILATPAPANEATLLKLALVTVTAGKVTGQPDNSVRRTAASVRANGAHLEISSVTKGGALRFRTGAPLAERLTITADGKVGVGISDPKETLDVGGDIRLDIHKLYFTDKNHGIGVYGAGNKFKDTDINGPVLHGFGGGALAINQDWPTGLIQKIALRWNDKGNVGIAATDPVAALQVRPAPSNIGNARFFSGVAALFSCNLDNGGNSLRDPETVMVLAREGVEGQSYANFARFDLGSYGDKRTQLNIRLTHDSLNSEADQTPVIIALRSNANVGIGTTNPTATLQVGKTGTSEGSPSVRIGWGANNEEDRLTIYTTDEYRMGLRRGSRDLKIFAKSRDNDAHIYLMPNDTVAMSLLSNGNVGIGTQEPPVRLAVRAAAKLEQLPGLFQSGGQSQVYHMDNAPVTGVAPRDWVMMGEERREVASVSGAILTVNPPFRPTPNTGFEPMYLCRPGPAPFRAEDFRGNELFSISGNGSISSPMWSVNTVIDQPGPLNIKKPFSTGGGTLILFASGSAFRPASSGAGTIGLSIFVDGLEVGALKSYTNETDSHKALVSFPMVVKGLSSGNHTIELRPMDPKVWMDFNDYFRVTILELPF